ncbi:MAG: NADPH-dependent oxidoreductase [Spirochaetales bacterium]|nr:NADPH-dependent oxidoreductase [Spirochaetales bacterium]
MNKTIETINNHRSIRQYTKQDVDEEQLTAILEAARSMPTSIHGQQLSIIVVKDSKRKQKISELAGNQVWVAQAPVFLVFVMDMNKTAKAGEITGLKQVLHESAEGVLVSSFDAGLAMGAAIIAAESLDLGIVPIGGIRRNPQEMIDLLELPEKTFPVAGLVVGHPADLSARKPRMSEKGFIHTETYDDGAVKDAVREFDETMAEYYRNRGDKESNWSSRVSGLYQSVYYPKVYPVLKSQDFLLDK